VSKLNTKRWLAAWTGIAAFASLALAPGWAAAADDDPLTYDPSRIIENETENCAQCHEKTVQAWARTTHARTYEELHLRDEAQAVLDRLGDRGSIRRNDECVRCHYTQHAREAGGRARTVMGISCQRCHGEAAEWLDIHQDTETYPDRTERLKLAEEKGMRPTWNIYELASSCFQCHTVPREDLVNKGEHPAGSAEFELVAWSQGEVRHNFLPLPDEAENKESSLETRRLMFVLGKILDIEYSLRALASATEEGTFATAMADRITARKGELEGLGLSVSEVGEVISAVPGDLAPGSGDAFTSAADKIGELAQAIEAGGADQLAAVDGKLPTEYYGEPYE